MAYVVKRFHRYYGDLIEETYFRNIENVRKKVREIIEDELKIIRILLMTLSKKNTKGMSMSLLLSCLMMADGIISFDGLKSNLKMSFVLNPISKRKKKKPLDNQEVLCYNIINPREKEVDPNERIF